MPPIKPSSILNFNLIGRLIFSEISFSISKIVFSSIFFEEIRLPDTSPRLMEINFKNSSIILSKKNIAVMVPNLTWCSLKFKNNKSIVMVVCDRKYEYNDYIEKYSDLLKILKK